MSPVTQRFAVGVLAAWLVLLSGLAYPQLAAHAAQHAHHEASAHATVLCSWLCVSADAVETAPVDIPRVEPGDVLEPALLATRIGLPLVVQPPSRAPPSI